MSTIPSPMPRDQRSIDNEHLKILAIFYYITSAMSLLGIGLIYFHFLLFTKFLPMMKTSPQFPIIPAEAISVFKWFYLAFAAFAFLAGLANFIAAHSLRKRKYPRLIFGIACLNCLQIPLGTLLGAGTIMVLMRDTVKTQFQETDHPID